VYSVMCAGYGVPCTIDITWVLIQLFVNFVLLLFPLLYCTVLYCTVLYCTVRNKASDVETVCTDCRHLKQLLSRHSLSLHRIAFLQTLSVVLSAATWVMTAN